MFSTRQKVKLTGYDVRSATEEDLLACNEICRRVRGHDRGGELRDAIRQGTAKVVEHLGRITGYATDIAVFAHAVSETTQDIEALIGAAKEIDGGGLFAPDSQWGTLPLVPAKWLKPCPSDDPDDGWAL
jgi:hypothetical protein